MVLRHQKNCQRWPSWAPVPNKPTVSVDVKQHSAKLRETRGGRRGLPVPNSNSPYDLCGRKAMMKKKKNTLSAGGKLHLSTHAPYVITWFRIK